MASVLTDRRCRQCRAEQAILYCGTGELVIDMKPILGRPHSHPGSTSLSVISRVPWLSRADPPRSARLRKTRRRRVTTTRLSGFGPQLVRSPATGSSASDRRLAASATADSRALMRPSDSRPIYVAWSGRGRALLEGAPFWQRVWRWHVPARVFNRGVSGGDGPFRIELKADKSR